MEAKGDEKDWVFATINTISVTATTSLLNSSANFYSKRISGSSAPIFSIDSLFSLYFVTNDNRVTHIMQPFIDIDERRNVL